ncbi:MAG: family 10 glycosylhydrolase [Maribacter sp.]
MTRFFSILFLLLFLSSCSIFRNYEKHPKTEFRGVWIATVVNIDWPKNGKDTAEKQKADYLNILNFYEKENYNAVIVQVRAAGDAFYDSEFAPWSRFLTGEEGNSPNWNTDVLEWMILETHKRGMEFHAWLNPYRATFDEDFEVLSDTHDYCTHPEWMVHYGKKNYYNPGLPAVRNQFTKIIGELVSQYDIDAVHFDDYFYPYKIKDEIFNDSVAYKEHSLANQNLEDWRRSNIDSLVKQVNDTIKSIKPWVQFGISPFGVWKNNSTDPKGSDTKAGQTTYEDLYADPLLWMEKGWIDYLAPQVYWSMNLPAASHRKIVDWWAKNNYGTRLYVGNGAYKVRNNSDIAWDDKKELPKQLELARMNPEISGNIMFSAKSLMKDNEDVVENIRKKFYKYPALTPTASGLNRILHEKPAVTSVQENSKVINLQFQDLSDKRYALIYKSGKSTKESFPIKKLEQKILLNGNTVTIPKAILKGKHMAISFVDKYGSETESQIIHLKKLEVYGSKR